ncbi:MAG: purine-nucleoside phosphorylase [Acidobacteria bacterium]|nr:purine-nucleoside phosphorylase [Acidobacteriota bacterium]
MSELEKLRAAAEFIRSHSPVSPRVGLVLGSGLGGLADEFSGAVRIPYRHIPHFPVSSVVGHPGNLVLGWAEGVAVAAMQGRVHPYEGYSFAEVVFPVRVLRLLGASILVVTNAAGGINESFRPGQLMLIRDHLNLMGDNPLRGQNLEELGPRFPDMTYPYDPALQELARQAADELGLEMVSGVYAGLSGPSYETPAEIRMLRKLGADAVGMSTVPETIGAHHMGMKVLGISCITNMAAGILARKLDHAEVMAIAERVQVQFVSLLRKVLGRLA